MNKTIIALAAALACQAAAAQEPSIVEIKTARYDQRKEDTASTLVLTREDLAAHGDRTVAEALRRLPGITIGDSGIRMRGLGNGYTQVLLNGLPAPNGFALETLPPESIERVEVLRNASAVLGTQGVAGTINVVLRRTVTRDSRELHYALDSLRGEPSPRLTAQTAGKVDGWSHNVSAVLARPSQPADRTITETAPGMQRATSSHEDNIGEALNISPRLSWSTARGDTISSQNLLNFNRRTIRLRSHEEVQSGASGDFEDVRSRFRVRALFLRSDLTWLRPLAGDAQLELKLGGSSSPRDTDFDFTGQPAQGPGPTTRHVDGDIREHGFHYGAKYSRPVGQGHALVAGIDGASTQRMQTRIEHEWSHAGALNFVRDDRYDGRIEKFAAYAQDEWKQGDDAWSAGLRWETLRTNARDRHSAAVRQHNQVLSPVLNWMRKLDGASQLRLSASRTFKAPNMLDLIPRRFTSDNNNSPTNPDSQGNPALRPELAWGLDAGYDYNFGKDGLLSAAAYWRDIDNVINFTLYQDNGRWISMPANRGKARVVGGTLEARLPLGERLALRANLALNRSRLSSVPGPDNRLSNQTPFSSTTAIEYRHAGLTLGAEFLFEAGGPSRSLPNYLATSPYQRKLDLRAAWKLEQRRLLRFSLSDVLRQNRTSVDRFEDGFAPQTWRQTEIASRTGITLRLSFEQKL